MHCGVHKRKAPLAVLPSAAVQPEDGYSSMSFLDHSSVDSHPPKVIDSQDGNRELRAWSP